MSCVLRIGWLYQDRFGLEWEITGVDDDDNYRLVPHGAFCAAWRTVTEWALDSEYKRVLP